MPAPRAVTVDPAGLDTLGEGTRQPEPDPSSFGDPDLTHRALSCWMPNDWPTNRKPSRSPFLRKVGYPKCCGCSKKLTNACVRSFRACCCTTLDPSASHGFSARAAVNSRHWSTKWMERRPGYPRALLESQVVHEPGVRTMSAQDRLLHDCRVHAVSVTHEFFEHTERVGQGSCRPGPATVTGWRVHRTWSPAPAAPAAAALAVAVAAVAPVRLLAEHPEHDEHLPGFREEIRNEKPPLWREAVTANSGAGSAPHGAFPPGSAKLEMADGTTRPRR